MISTHKKCCEWFFCQPFKSVPFWWRILPDSKISTNNYVIFFRKIFCSGKVFVFNLDIQSVCVSPVKNIILSASFLFYFSAKQVPFYGTMYKNTSHIDEVSRETFCYILYFLIFYHFLFFLFFCNCVLHSFIIWLLFNLKKEP